MNVYREPTDAEIECRELAWSDFEDEQNLVVSDNPSVYWRPVRQAFMNWWQPGDEAKAAQAALTVLTALRAGL